MIDYRDYPPNWKSEIRPRIMARAKNKCEWCHAENGVEGVRYPDGRFEPFIVAFPDVDPHGTYFDRDFWEVGGARIITIVLTVAHLDHDKENWDVKDDRLAALCQRCHLNYDRPHHLEVQKANRDRKKGPFLADDFLQTQVKTPVQN